ncbi:lysophospholipid acyltransferase family protein [Marinomonas transparens]|uniref:L-ornithine N(alpha)-acyltransferase n=1 Tax=Marinomonas transparens TaxID=2795388 RepID=A0A934JMG2_9GAMM|nr:lysophospholipid acyltransferase family protein [Marinomonas transparens]MBJ7536223.1 lysophospholipid acyltransferase family protein [Marinomonas transparens]
MTSPFRLPHFTPFGIGESFVEWLSGLSKLDDFYQQRPLGLSSVDFMKYTLKALNASYYLEQGSLDNIPQTGPVVIVANHPLGAIEGVILAALIAERRQDIKVLANQMLKRVPEISELFIGVDVFGGKTAKQTNSIAIRDANQHLSDGGLLVIFPAGEVSSYPKGSKVLSDVTWSNSVAKFVKRAQATTVPIFINGKNSPLFYRAGRVHPLLRTALLGKELLNKRESSIALSIGSPIPYSEVSEFQKDQDLVHYLRLNTYLMSSKRSLNKGAVEASMAPIIDAIAVDKLEQEINALPEEMLLVEQGCFAVYCAPSQSIPELMKEIGRIREENFRAVGEGTGLACDLDEFDRYYHQLFVWHRDNKEIVGSYRLGLVDELIKEKGLESLYSRSLFEYDQAFIDSLDNSIEVGRSVVAAHYQKNLNSLFMLWKGIATFVHRHPKYTHLFGPVSISNEYSHSARELMAAVLSIHFYDQQKAALVAASTPLKNSEMPFWQPHLLTALASVSLLSKVLAKMESGKGLPILLRQYLKMNGKLVCFNVDSAFNNTLDGLIVVNLKDVPVKTLGKYMGRAEAESYLQK